MPGPPAAPRGEAAVASPAGRERAPEERAVQPQEQPQEQAQAQAQGRGRGLENLLATVRGSWPRSALPSSRALSREDPGRSRRPAWEPPPAESLPTLLAARVPRKLPRLAGPSAWPSRPPPSGAASRQGWSSHAHCGSPPPHREKAPWAPARPWRWEWTLAGNPPAAFPHALAPRHQAEGRKRGPTCHRSTRGTCNRRWEEQEGRKAETIGGAGSWCSPISSWLPHQDESSPLPRVGEATGHQLDLRLPQRPSPVFPLADPLLVKGLHEGCRRLIFDFPEADEEG